MQRRPPFSFLPDLEMPMRDAMRGIANLAEATEDTLEPAAQLLPEPLRAGVKMAVKSLETTGRQLIRTEVDHDQIRTARAFADGPARDPEAARDFAKVVCFAWGHLQKTHGKNQILISETILLTACTRATPEGAGAARAAGLIDVIRASSAIGRMPGIANVVGAEHRRQIDLSLTAILIWLLARRADTLAEEGPLLDLAQVLVTACEADVGAAIDDPAKTAEVLRNLSAYL